MFAHRPARRTTRGLSLAVATAGVLSACYVIPMNADGSPAWQYAPQPVAAAAPGGVVAVPAVAPGPPGPSTYQARLYPINDQAARDGQLLATITDLHTGRGMLTMTKDGEFLSGEATRVSDAHPGFGTVYEKALRTPIRVRPGQPRGIANATGSRGTWVNCEYMIEGGGRGTGACLMSNGAAYQIHFGS